LGLLIPARAAAGGGRVDVVDRNTDRLPTAAEFGARRSGGTVAELDRGGWDVAVDATGNPAAVADAVAHLRRTGRLALLGVASSAATFAFAPFDVVARELTIVGINSVRHTFGRAARLLPSLPARLLHDDPLPLADAGAAIERVRSSTGLKTRVLVGGPR
jgi:threonine dehydrogenase-like Zn-dependent dehydrogenase